MTAQQPVPTPMHEALALAHDAIGLSDPNPRVGCVITAADGRVIGRGHTQQAGGAHAEVMALRDAQAHGESVHGATVYLTLEPCSHHGRTAPCCDALIEAGVARVVMAVQDPNPLVAGQGAARLRAAGIAVESGPLAIEARELNIGFFARMQRGRPWVRMKIAASIDGHTALLNGASQWITGEAARIDGHAWRKRAGAILTGVGTVLADDPRLDVRLVATRHQPLRVVADSQLRTPSSAALLVDRASALIFTADPADTRIASLRAQGVQVVQRPAADGRVDLNRLIDDLAQRGVNELHVEAGPALNGALLQAGLVDEVLLYLAPCFLGSARGMVTFGPLERLIDAPRLCYQSVDRVGDDLRIVARLTRAETDAV